MVFLLPVEPAMLTRMGIPDRLTRKMRAFRPVFANRDLRRVLLAFLLFGLAKWGFRISILVFAYERGGPVETGLVAAIQLFPAALAAPLASVLGDRLRRDHALALGYGIQTVAVGGTAVALIVDAPMWVVYILIAVVAASITLTRPVQSALFPQLARTPDELTAANVVAGVIWGAFALAGPAIAGILIGTRPMSPVPIRIPVTSVWCSRSSPCSSWGPRCWSSASSRGLRRTRHTSNHCVRPPPDSRPWPGTRTSAWWSAS